MNVSGKEIALLGEPSDVPLLRKLGALISVSGEEAEFLKGLLINKAEISTETDLIREGDEFRSSFVLESGWAFRYRLLEDGRRQIIGIVLPGDVIGLNINFRRTATYSVQSKTKCVFALVEPTRILEIQQRYPVLSSALNWITVREFSILAEQTVRLGRHTAYERVVHLLLELHNRLGLVGLADDDSFQLQLSQIDLSDILGLSTVHVYRTLRRLTKDGLISIQSNYVVLEDVDRLIEVADLPEAFLEDFAVL